MQIFKTVFFFLCFLGLVCCQYEDDTADNNTETFQNSTFLTSVTDEISTRTSIDTDGDKIFSTDFQNETETTTISEQTSTEDTTLEPLTTENGTISPEVNWTACSENPCRNGGTCLEDSGSFSCHCISGYLGSRCGTSDACAVNQDEKLCDQGACVYSEDASSRFCKCFPGKYWNNTEKTCSDPVPPCFPSPCENGGTCKEEKGGFLCECPTGYEGQTCSIRNICGEKDACPKGRCITDEKAGLKFCQCKQDSYWNENDESCEVKSPCVPNPCRNSGGCEALLTGGFNCSCPEEYSGIQCEIRDYCTADESCNGGQCTLLKTNSSRSCQCKEGHYLDETSHSCKENHKPCLPNPCANDGICVSVDSTNFNCTCSEGFVGERCTERDLCVLDGGNAYCGGASCLTHSKLGVFYCSCFVAEYFDYGDRKCKDVELCPLVHCQSNNICLRGHCLCKEKYKWNNNTSKCEPNFCASNPCPANDMECNEGHGNEGPLCTCKEGYSFDGESCKEASCVFPHLNLCSQECETSGHGYVCGCHENFEIKEDNITCIYVGNMTCTNKTCENGACVRTDEDETCVCPAGYSEVDGNCVDDCTSGKLPQGFCPGDRCEAVPGFGFRCKCEGKFVLSQDKVTCSMRKMCRESEIGWTTCSSLNATCVEDWSTADGFACACADDQIVSEQGVCFDVCNIEKNQRFCSSMGAVCDVDAVGNRICRCPPFFQMNDEETFCNKPAEFSFLVTLPLDGDTYRNRNQMRRSLINQSGVDYHRVQKDVSRTMHRLFAEFETVNVLNCEVRTDYMLCKMELQFQQISRQELNRLKIEDLCVSNDDEVVGKCLLFPSLVLRKDKAKTEILIEATDPCDEDVKENLCGSETSCSSALDKKTFNCTCKAGFIARRRVYPFKGSHSFLEVCKDVDECDVDNPCQENSKCTNTIGSYACSCLPGYRIDSDGGNSNQEKCVQQCNPNPCLHGACTIRGDHDFECSCDAGFAGVTCNLQDGNFKQAKLNTIIVGAVLGGVLLLTVILFIASVTKLRKKKFLDDPSHMLYNAAEMTERRPADSGAINNAFQRE